MKNLPLISVIVPIYNVEEYLPRCLDSIIGQSYKNLEIILVDDGSGDYSSQICDQYEQKDSRIKVIHQKNKGLPSARNSGMDLMQGDFFTFVDADDWIRKDCIELLYQEQQKTNADLITSSFYYAFDSHIIEKRFIPLNLPVNLPPGQFLFSLLKQQNFFAWNKLYRRSWVANNRFDPRYSIAEDWYFVSHMSKKAGRLAHVKSPLYFYYQRPSSLLHTGSSQQWYLAMRLGLHRYNEFKKNNYTPLQKELQGSLFSFAGAFALVALLEKPAPLHQIRKARKIFKTHLLQLPTAPIIGIAGKTFALLLVFFPHLLHKLCQLSPVNRWLKEMFSKTR